MRIIELCGLPGVGKSTLVKNYLSTYPGYDYITRDEFLNKNKIVRRINTLFQYVIYCLGFKYKSEAPLYRFINEYPQSSIFFRIRLIDMYRKLRRVHKSKNVILFEEGPIQYLSSIPFDTEIHDTADLTESLNLLGNHEIIIINCVCSIDTSMDRIKGRNKGPDRYSHKADEELRRILKIKRDNLDILIKLSGFRSFDINMESTLNESTEELYKIIHDWH